MPAVSPPMLLKRLSIAFAAVGSLLVAFVPAPALASCAMPPAIVEALSKADIVFVGTVAATAERNLWATVTVEEVWKGPDLPAVFQVRGGQGGNGASSVDREFTKGVKYLFVPSSLENGFAADNSCSSTRPWEEALIALRPTDVRGPIGGSPPAQAGFDFGGLLAPLAVAILVAGVLLAVGLLARSRQSA